MHLHFERNTFSPECIAEYKSTLEDDIKASTSDGFQKFLLQLSEVRSCITFQNLSLQSWPKHTVVEVLTTILSWSGFGSLPVWHDEPDLGVNVHFIPLVISFFLCSSIRVLAMKIQMSTRKQCLLIQQIC